jgi:hypothetical protein
MQNTPEESTNAEIPNLNWSDVPALFKQFGDAPTIVAVLAVWTRETVTGMLEEKGLWVQTLWRNVLRERPDAHGARILWNTFLVVIPNCTIEDAKALLKRIHAKLHEPRLESYCVISALDESNRTDVVNLIDEMQGETAAAWNFHHASKFKDKLLDGEEYHRS